MYKKYKCGLCRLSEFGDYIIKSLNESAPVFSCRKPGQSYTLEGNELVFSLIARINDFGIAGCNMGCGLMSG